MMFRTSTRLFRLVGNECVAEDLEQSRLALPASATEGVNGRTYIDVYETTFFQHPPPACARQATGDSVGPEVDVADRRFRYRLSGGDVSKLQLSTWAEHAEDFVEHTALVGAKVDDAVADEHIGTRVLDWQILDHALAELGV